jgi:DNA-binding transcriptional LysR family regulator
MARTEDPHPEPLPHLDTFAKAAELCNFTLTARALNLSQAAVSQRIQLLEKAVGTSLFRRHGGRVELTKSGRMLYEFAQRILSLHDEARRRIGGEDTRPRGELLLAASSIPGEHLLPALLAEFRERHPLIWVRVAISDSTAVIDHVQRGQAHLGLVGGKSESPDLEYRHLANDRMILVARPDHPLCRRRRVTLKRMPELPLVLREAGSGLRQFFEAELERAGVAPSSLNVVLELGSNEAIKEAVHRGMGLAVLSTFAVQRELEAGTLQAVTMTGLRCEREIYIVLNRRRVLPLPARVFLNFVETHPIKTS